MVAGIYPVHKVKKARIVAESGDISAMTKPSRKARKRRFILATGIAEDFIWQLQLIFPDSIKGTNKKIRLIAEEC